MSIFEGAYRTEPDNLCLAILFCELVGSFQRVGNHLGVSDDGYTGLIGQWGEGDNASVINVQHGSGESYLNECT